MNVRQRKPNEHKVYYGWRNRHHDDYQIKVIKQRDQDWFHIVNNWFKANREAFAIPLSFSWRPKKKSVGRYGKRKQYRYKADRKRALVLKFQHLTPCIQFSIGRGFTCCASADYPVNQKGWDLIFDSDIAPEQLEDGRWVCDFHYRWHQQNPDTVPLEAFSSLQALTEKFMLEPFLKWINEEVAVSKWLCLYETDSGGMTWATLEKEEIDQAERYRMQLRHEQFSAGLIKVDENPNTPKVIPTKVNRDQPVHQLPLFVK